MTFEPVASVTDTAVAYRRELTAEWLTATQVSRMLGSRAENSSQLATDQRRAGKLLGVWLPSERIYSYSSWQFRADGAPVPQMREIL